MDILKGIRPLDYVLTAVLAAGAVLLAFENINLAPDAKAAHAVDSHSMLMLPVFVLAALPVLWRRRAVVAAIGVSFAVMAASVPMFGWVTRCGFGLPLGFALAYALARFGGSRQNHVIGMVGLLALQVAVLMKDASTNGLGALGLSVPLTLVSYAIGYAVQHQAAKRVTAPTNGPTLDAERVHA